MPLTVGLERKPETSASLRFGSSLPKVSEVRTILDVGLDGPLVFFLRFFEVHPTIVQHKLREDILLFCHLGCFVIWRYLKGILRKFRDCFRWNAAPWISNRRCNICACGWCIFILGSRNCYTCSIRLYTSKSLLTPYYLSTILHTKQALWPTWEYYCWVLPPPAKMPPIATGIPDGGGG